MTAILKEKKNYEKKGNNMSCPHGNSEDECEDCQAIDDAWNSGYKSAYDKGFAAGKLEQWNEFAGMDAVRCEYHYDGEKIPLIRRPERKTE